MIVIDFHGDRLEEAVEEIHSQVTAARAARQVRELKIITGHGIIRQKVQEILREYGLNPRIQLGNDGVILCEIE